MPQVGDSLAIPTAQAPLSRALEFVRYCSRPERQSAEVIGSNMY